MKTILVDAWNTLFTEEGINEQIRNILDSYENKKVVLTNADDGQIKELGIDKSPYEVFTLKHNPDKIDPTYYKKMLDSLGLKPENVIYFEHNLDAVESAKKNNIITHHYDKDKRDLVSLERFISEKICKERATLIIKKQDDGQEKILTIHRLKFGQEFYIFPGGGVEIGELPHQAALREMQEETGLTGESFIKTFEIFNVYDNKINHVFECKDYSGKLEVGGPEKRFQSDENQFLLEWKTIDEIRELKVLPVPVREKLLSDY